MASENKDRKDSNPDDLRELSENLAQEKPAQPGPAASHLSAQAEQDDGNIRSFEKLKMTADKARQAFANEMAIQ
jgi:hypothetical protein